MPADEMRDLTPSPAPASIAERLSGRDNNLNAIRLIAAALVLFSHCYPLTGHGEQEPIARLLQVFDGGALAVLAFFFLSGYLISASWTAAPRLPSFMLKRALRILPALAVVVTLCALVLGPALSSLDLGHYFDSGQAFRYIRDNINVLSLRTNTLPGLFEGLPIPQAVNGSLWTLKTEIWVYIGTAIVGAGFLLPSEGKGWKCTLYAVVMLALAARISMLTRAEWETRHLPLDFYSYRLIVAYMLGSTAFAIRHWLPRSWFLLAGLAGVCWLAWNAAIFNLVFYIAYGYFLLLLATADFALLGKAVRTHDYSYGTYIYAFPIQQTIVLLVPAILPLTLFAIALPIVAVCAVLSWHLIEKPSLRLKNLSFKWRLRTNANG